MNEICQCRIQFLFIVFQIDRLMKAQLELDLEIETSPPAASYAGVREEVIRMVKDRL